MWCDRGTVTVLLDLSVRKRRAVRWGWGSRDGPVSQAEELGLRHGRWAGGEGGCRFY